MSDDPHAQEKAEAAKLDRAGHERAIKNSADQVVNAIKWFTEDDRKRVLDMALNELGSRLGVVVPR